MSVVREGLNSMRDWTGDNPSSNPMGKMRRNNSKLKGSMIDEKENSSRDLIPRGLGREWNSHLKNLSSSRRPEDGVIDPTDVGLKFLSLEEHEKVPEAPSDLRYHLLFLD